MLQYAYTKTFYNLKIFFTLKKHFGRDFPEVILVDEWGQQGELVGVTQNPDGSG